ncbi:MAG: alpha/beta fold hydrolase [Bacteroidota bacterium]
MQLNFKTLGQGPPLVILHGLFGTLDNWQTLAKRWANDFTVYLVDQRNHGKSPHVATHNYPAMAEDLAAFLEQEWIHECYLLGHSMGGKTAMKFAMDYPDQVEKLVVVDMTPKKYPAGHNKIFAAMFSLDLANLSSRSEATEQLSAQLDDPGVVQFLLKNLSRIPGGGFRWKMNLDVLYRDYEEILKPIDGEPFMGDSLFINGGKSDYVQASDLPLIQAYFSAAALVTVAEAGHWVHAEKPDQLYSIVSDFLRS